MTSSAEPTSHRAERSRRRRIARRLLVVGVAFMLVGGAAIGAVYWKLNSNITSTTVSDHLVKADDTPTGALNVLFIGSDSRAGTKGYGSTEGRRSDALMLVHFASDNSRIDAVQIPRDTLLDLPSCPDSGNGGFAGGYGMINSALEFGQGCTVRAVESLSDVHVDHFVELDFKGFSSMVDALGGVGVCLPEALQDRDAKLDLPAGEQDLNGTDALALARTRHAVGDGSDIGRIGHQQMVMSAIIARAQSSGVLARPDKLFSFLNAVTKSITVDEEISSIKELTKLAQRARKVESKDITFIAMPNAAAPTDPNRVVATEDATTVFQAIGKDREVKLVDDDDDEGDESAVSTKGKEAPVRLFNAARTQGIATAAQNAMTPLGYQIQGPLADAPEPAEATQILVDGTPEAQATAEAINKDFGLDAEIVDGGADVTGVWLMLGSDRVGQDFAPVEGEPVKATTRHADADLCT